MAIIVELSNLILLSICVLHILFVQPVFSLLFDSTLQDPNIASAKFHLTFDLIFANELIDMKHFEPMLNKLVFVCNFVPTDHLLIEI